MRIASSQFQTTMTSALQDVTTRNAEMLQRMASGQKLLLPSDDPVTAVRLSRLTREEAALDQYSSNIDALRTRLQKNESLLDGISGDLLQVRDQLVWASDGGNSPDDVAAMASTLSSLRDSLLFTANSRDEEGRYLFSGTTSQTPTISFDATQPAGSRYGFGGNTGAQQVVVGSGVTQTANVSLPAMATLLNQLDTAIALFETPGGVNVNDPAIRSQVTAAFNGTDDALTDIGTRIAALGGAQNTLQTLGDNQANISLSNKQAAITLGQLDYADAKVTLDSTTAALQATMKSYAMVSGLSLFNVL
jgi:flagellar hook-associated protein 3 FlgL